MEFEKGWEPLNCTLQYSTLNVVNERVTCLVFSSYYKGCSQLIVPCVVENKTYINSCNISQILVTPGLPPPYAPARGALSVRHPSLIAGRPPPWVHCCFAPQPPRYSNTFSRVRANFATFLNWYSLYLGNNSFVYVYTLLPFNC